jgi:hypothetical protein
MYRTIGAVVTIPVLGNRTAWGSAKSQAMEAPGIVVKTESASGQPSDQLTFTPVVQRTLPVGPDGPLRRGGLARPLLRGRGNAPAALRPRRWLSGIASHRKTDSGNVWNEFGDTLLLAKQPFAAAATSHHQPVRPQRIWVFLRVDGRNLTGAS